jgi:O-antigen ligase
MFFAVMALTANKKIVLILALALGVSGTVIIAPQVQESLYNRVVVKGNSEGEIFYSRYKPWSDSYHAALQGGYFGLGYGVSAGHKEFELGLTAETYGREKGNAQLAIWEETGLVGLTLYTILFLAIFKTFFRAYRAAQGNNDLRVMLGIVGGAALGMIFESVFEAWWVAPGSIESAGFWAIVGIGAGISRQAIASRRPVRLTVERATPIRAGLLHRPAAGKSTRLT